jgi:hypothetical protein
MPNCRLARYLSSGTRCACCQAGSICAPNSERKLKAHEETLASWRRCSMTVVAMISSARRGWSNRSSTGALAVLVLAHQVRIINKGLGVEAVAEAQPPSRIKRTRTRLRDLAQRFDGRRPPPDAPNRCGFWRRGFW